MINRKPRVIVVEGFDGTGKSTVAKWLAETYGYQYQKSPGGGFAKAREFFDSYDSNIYDRMAFYMADCMRLSMLIKRNSKTRFVIDRYYYSTIAYHEARQKGITKYLKPFYRIFQKPDLVIHMISDYESIKKRIVIRNENALNDELFMEEQLYNKINENYKKLIDVPILVINNNENIESVFNKINLFLG